MKNIWILTVINVKRYYYAVLLSILGAGILSLLLYTMGNLVADITIARINVGVLDYDRSAASLDFKDYMKEELQYQLLEDYTYDELTSELIDKDISVIIEIPADFQKQLLGMKEPEILVTSLEDYENTAFVKAYLNSYITSIRTLAAGAGGNNSMQPGQWSGVDQDLFEQMLQDYHKQKMHLSQSTAATIDLEEVAGKNGFMNSIGFYLMFVFAISIILAFMVSDDRVTGVFHRIQVAPVKPVQYILGTGVFGLLLCFLQVGVFTAYIYYAKINTGIPIGIIVVMLVLFSLFTVCFSIMIALSTKSKNAITAIVVGFSTIGCILGGAYFPIDLAPASLQNMARILPQYWFMDVFRKIQKDQGANIYPNIIILSLFIILSFLIGAVLFSQYNESGTRRRQVHLHSPNGAERS